MASQAVWRKINWMSRSKMVAILEKYGFAVYEDESTQSIRNSLAANVDDGTIPEWELD